MIRIIFSLFVFLNCLYSESIGIDKVKNSSTESSLYSQLSKEIKPNTKQPGLRLALYEAAILGKKEDLKEIREKIEINSLTDKQKEQFAIIFTKEYSLTKLPADFLEKITKITKSNKILANAFVAYADANDNLEYYDKAIALIPEDIKTVSTIYRLRILTMEKNGMFYPDIKKWINSLEPKFKKHLESIASANEALVGKTAPIITNKAYKTNKLINTESIKETTVLYFFSSWANVCLPYNAMLQEIPNTKIIGIAAETNESITKLDSYISSQNIKFDIVIDGEAFGNLLAKKYKIEQIPHIIIIDKNKIIIDSFATGVKKAKARINYLLKDK